MEDYTALTLNRQREERLRRTTGRPSREREGIRRRTARRLHRIARSIDVTDL